MGRRSGYVAGMRSLLLLVGLAACAASSAPDSGGAGGTSDDAAPGRQPLRVASFNADWLWSTHGDGETPRNATDTQMMGRLLTDYGLEVVGLQEIDGPGALALLDLQGDWAWVTGESGWNQNVAIAWRDDVVQVTNAREVELPSFADANKKPLVADITSRHGDLAFSLVVIHHHPYADAESSAERATQATELYAWITEKLSLSTIPPYDENIVLMGDFNDTFDGIYPALPSLTPFTDDPAWDFATAYTGHFTQIPYMSQIDHIALWGGARGRQVAAGTSDGVHIIPHEQTSPWSDYADGWDHPNPTISDHRPLWVGLEHSAASE
jgi:endonuclease/exonuclease/phosphatase family metal-dependent hydrolase